MEKELVYYEQLVLSLYEGGCDGYEFKDRKRGDDKKDLYDCIEQLEREIDGCLCFDSEQEKELKKIYNVINEFISIKEGNYTLKEKYNKLELLNYDYNNNTIHINNYKLTIRNRYTISDYFNYSVDQFVLDGNYYDNITDLSNAIFYNKEYFDLTYYDEFECCKDHDTLYHEIDCLTDKFKNRIQFTCADFEGCYNLREIEINHVSAATDTVFFNFKSSLKEDLINNIIETYLYDNY